MNEVRLIGLRSFAVDIVGLPVLRRSENDLCLSPLNRYKIVLKTGIKDPLQSGNHHIGCSPMSTVIIPSVSSDLLHLNEYDPSIGI